MNIAVLQHAGFEGPGEIATWATGHGHRVSVHHLYRGDALPGLDAFDLLVIMGGEMNIYQYRDWPWLKPESALIRAALMEGKRAVGICLGAQLIANALGAQIVQNAQIELGWLPVRWTDEARSAFPELPASSTVLHWHGDTFGLPPNAKRLAVSEGCPEQGFLIPGLCLGLQFHMEVDMTLTREYVEGQIDWPEGSLVQSREMVLGKAGLYCDENRRLLHGMLDQFFGTAP